MLFKSLFDSCECFSRLLGPQGEKGNRRHWKSESLLFVYILVGRWQKIDRNLRVKRDFKIFQNHIVMFSDAIHIKICSLDSCLLRVLFYGRKETN